jgi:hypothetical protein
MAAKRTKPVAKTPDADTGLVEAACGCGAGVGTIDVAASAVLVDKEQDERGEFHGFTMGGRWVFTTANTDGVGGQRVHYRRHRCPVTIQADMRRTLDERDTEGPCAGYCGRRCPCGCRGRVPNRYGPNAEMMCPGCSARRAATLGQTAV